MQTRLIEADAPMAAHPHRNTRHMTVLINAAISQHGRTGLCRIRNVSVDGLAVETSLPLFVGEEARIALSSGREARCIIRWVQGGQAGMSCSTDLTPLLLEDRAERLAPRPGPALPRFSPAATVSIHVASRRRRCGFDSLSTSDVLLYDAPELAEHDRITVAIHGLGSFPAVVSICEEGDLFARFIPPLPFRLLDEWLGAQV